MPRPTSGAGSISRCVTKKGRSASWCFEAERAEFATEEQRELVTILANQTTVAIRNAQLYARVPMAGTLTAFAAKRQQLFAIPRRNRMLAVTIALLLLAALTLIQWPFRVDGDCPHVPADGSGRGSRVDSRRSSSRSWSGKAQRSSRACPWRDSGIRRRGRSGTPWPPPSPRPNDPPPSPRAGEIPRRSACNGFARSRSAASWPSRTKRSGCSCCVHRSRGPCSPLDPRSRSAGCSMPARPSR